MTKTYKEKNTKLKELVENVLREYEYDDYDDGYDDFEPHSSDDDEDSLLAGFDDFDKMIGNGKQVSDNDIISQTNDEEEDDDYRDDIWGDEESEENGGESLYDDAKNAIESSGGDISFKEWFSELEGISQEEAKIAFDKAMEEYNQDEYEVDNVEPFDSRVSTQVQKEVEPEHKAGNVIEYDGIEIQDNGNQFVMVANVNNPEIVIKGSKLNDVKNTYNSLWRDISTMEDRARKMGLTVYHGALVWGDDYDKFVRSAGAHEPDLPIIIDLDKIRTRNSGQSSTVSTQQTSDDEPAWLKPYRHDLNGKYMLTNYQVSRLTPEQRSEWERLKRMNPTKYASYSEALSTKKNKQI